MSLTQGEGCAGLLDIGLSRDDDPCLTVAQFQTRSHTRRLAEGAVVVCRWLCQCWGQEDGKGGELGVESARSLAIGSLR
jgi:hypothetical protein